MVRTRVHSLEIVPPYPTDLMNTALALPHGLRHPSWYIPLLLPILPLIAAYGDNTNLFDNLLGTAAMIVLGLVYSVGLGAFVDLAPKLVRKEIEQLRPAWLLGLFAAQCGLMFRQQNNLDEILLLPPLLFALLASLSFGIEFQQRTMPSLLCAPVDRLQLWRIKMSVLAAAMLSQIVILVVSAVTAVGFISSHIAILTGFALAFAFAAWATVPLWTLLTRNLLAGLVFALAIPSVTLALVGSLVEWVSSPFGIASNLSTVTLWTLGMAYLIGAPWFARQRWLSLEAPDLPEREISGLFLGRRQSTTARTASPRSWLRSLIGKELRLQTVTLVSLAVALLLSLAKPYLPQAILSQDLASLMIGLFAVVTILLAGSTAIAEERRLGTLDGQVLLPVSRTAQWLLKLGLGFAISTIATVLIVLVVPASFGTGEFYLQIPGVLVLFVFTFLASSAAPNSLRALLLGLGFTGTILAACYAVAAMGLMADNIVSSPERVQMAIEQPEALLAQARALSEAEAAALQTRVIPRFLLFFLVAASATASLPLLLALAFSRQNFNHPSAASRRLNLQFPTCMLATLLAGGCVVGAALWLQIRTVKQGILIMARREVDLVARLSPAELKLRDALRGQRLDDTAESFTFRRRVPSGGIDPVLLPPPTSLTEPTATKNAGSGQVLHWSHVIRSMPLDRPSRGLLILDGDIPEDIRDALRQEAIAKGDPDIPATPGRPPGPWPEDNAPKGFQMSQEMIRRYGLTTQLGIASPIAPRSTNTPPAVDVRTSPNGNPARRYPMSPELMKRYGLLPAPAPSTNTISPTSDTTPATPPAP